MNRNGFTLIELSIVIVIIGLIAAGILVGTDLINAARIRAQISQIENMNSAVNTFRLKYNGLPGDLASHKAAAFGMTPRSGLPRHGDDNYLLQSCVSANRSNVNFGCELAIFWNDLAFAGLIPGDFSQNVDQSFGGIQANTQQIKNHFPPARIGGENWIAIFSDDQRDSGLIITVDCPPPFCFALANIVSTNAIGQYEVSKGSVTPIQAYSIDQKMDDGLPLKGVVQSSSKTGLGSMLSVTGNAYNPLDADKGCYAENSSIGVLVWYKSALSSQISYALSGMNANLPVCMMSFSYR